ncbi:MAG: hypothetical protein ACRD23_07690 [Terriglobales bacterium]
MSDSSTILPSTAVAFDAVAFRVFSERMAGVARLDSGMIAIGILCWHDLRRPGVELSTWELAKLMVAYGMGNPNRATLESKLSRSPLTLKGSGGFLLKAGARDAVRQQLSAVFEPALPEVNLETGFLPQEVWKDTRGYIEKVCVQLNGSYQFGFYDAGSVMVRRAVETLIIEAYEHLHREAEIRDAEGNYFMLGELVNRSTNTGGLTLGREARAALKEIKKLGDRSAHNRRYNAVKADLDDIRSGVRVTVDELINIASLRRVR